MGLGVGVGGGGWVGVYVLRFNFVLLKVTSSYPSHLNYNTSCYSLSPARPVKRDVISQQSAATRSPSFSK